MKSKLGNLSEDELKSYALRLLIHYIGDLHQPLHSTSRVNPQYPKGDAGGNFVKIPTKGGAKNLHSVWDSVIYEYTATPTMVSFNPKLNFFNSHLTTASGVILEARLQRWKVSTNSQLESGKISMSRSGQLRASLLARTLSTRVLKIAKLSLLHIFKRPIKP